MNNNSAEDDLHRARISIQALCVRLRDAVALVERNTDADPTDARRTAMDEVGSVVAELQALCAGPLLKPADVDTDEDRRERAISEVRSDEFDVQG